MDLQVTYGLQILWTPEEQPPLLHPNLIPKPDQVRSDATFQVNCEQLNIQVEENQYDGIRILITYRIKFSLTKNKGPHLLFKQFTFLLLNILWNIFPSVKTTWPTFYNVEVSSAGIWMLSKISSIVCILDGAKENGRTHETHKLTNKKHTRSPD